MAGTLRGLRTPSNTGLPDRTWVEIDLDAVRANASTIQARAGTARLLPMVKANAYGLGAVPIAKALEPLDPWGFGVATADEGRELRQAGIVRPILVVQPTVPMLEACARDGLIPVLGGADEVRAWLGLGALPFHVGVDTGMNRGGIWWEVFAASAALFADAPGFEGVATHFHSADTSAESVREQWDRFQAALRALPRRPAMVHAANSAAALSHPETAGDLVRPGIFLYGGNAGPHVPLPVVTWRARVCRTAWREAGATVSYGARWKAARRTCVVTLAAGYADGVRRSLSNRGAAMIGGERCPILGSVTMDFTMAAAGHEPGPDAVATLVGDGLTLDDVAAQAGTISYELLTGIGARVRRIYR